MNVSLVIMEAELTHNKADHHLISKNEKKKKFSYWKPHERDNQGVIGSSEHISAPQTSNTSSSSETDKGIFFFKKKYSFFFFSSTNTY